MLDSDRFHALLPYAFLNEHEPLRDADGQTRQASVSTLFLTASRCPIGCTMCDLHRNTLPHATPPGAIVSQIEYAQQRLTPSEWIKLYNGGNFFDARSIPVQDHTAIAERCDNYRRVIVENHPRFGLRRHERLRDLFHGRLEIAVGLETVQPRWLDRLGKQISRDDFDRYARFLRQADIDLRVFLIVGVPGTSVSESLRWAQLSLRHAIAAGARHISLIPARAGEGWGGNADRLPDIKPDALADLLGRALDDAPPPVCVSVDLWDIGKNLQDEAKAQTLRRIETAILFQDPGRL